MCSYVCDTIYLVFSPILFDLRQSSSSAKYFIWQNIKFLLKHFLFYQICNLYFNMFSFLTFVFIHRSKPFIPSLELFGKIPEHTSAINPSLNSK